MQIELKKARIKYSSKLNNLFDFVTKFRDSGYMSYLVEKVIPEEEKFDLKNSLFEKEDIKQGEKNYSAMKIAKGKNIFYIKNNATNINEYDP